MARYRRMNMAIRPIQRIKHIVDNSATLTAGTTLVNVLAEATDTPTLAVTNSVSVGSKINGIFLNVQMTGNEADAGQIPNVYMIIYKNPGGLITSSINPTSTGDDNNKKLIIHQEMVMNENSATGTPRSLFKGVIVIPKGMRRFGSGDSLDMATRSTAQNITLCSQAIYKEFK